MRKEEFFGKGGICAAQPRTFRAPMSRKMQDTPTSIGSARRGVRQAGDGADEFHRFRLRNKREDHERVEEVPGEDRDPEGDLLATVREPGIGQDGEDHAPEQECRRKAAGRQAGACHAQGREQIERAAAVERGPVRTTSAFLRPPMERVDRNRPGTPKLTKKMPAISRRSKPSPGRPGQNG